MPQMNGIEAAGACIEKDSGANADSDAYFA